MELKNEKGEGYIALILYGLLILGVIGYGLFQLFYPRIAGNKTVIDLKYKYDKAIITMNNEKIEIEIDSWSDYEGEQIQIIGKNGKVYLVSSFNTILVKE